MAKATKKAATKKAAPKKAAAKKAVGQKKSGTRAISKTPGAKLSHHAQAWERGEAVECLPDESEKAPG